MTARIEARRLSGEHVGQMVEVPWPSWSTGPISAATGTLEGYAKVDGSVVRSEVTVRVREANGTLIVRHLAPTDLVTIAGGPAGVGEGA